MPNYRLERDSIQYKFNKSRAKVQVFGGGFGNGKTTALVIKALQIAQDYPGANILLARSTYPKLNDTLRKEFLRWCPTEWVKRKPTQEDNTAYLDLGDGAITTVNFRYIAQRGKQNVDGSTTSNLLSATYDFIGVDQMEDPEIVEKDWLDLLGRLRGQTTYRPADGANDETMPSTGPRWIVLTCNPTHNWLYKKLVQPFIIWRDRGVKTEGLLVDTETGLPLVELFEGSTYTNAANLPEDFIRTQEAAYKGQMRERFLLGKWAAFEGLVHPDFSVERNTISRTQAEMHLANCMARHVKVKPLEGYDFGLVSPSCYLNGFVDDFGRVIIMDGFYKAEFNYAHQPSAIEAIRAKSMQWINYDEPIEADPAIFRRQVIAGHKDTGTTLAALFREMDIYMRPATNDILSGVAKVNNYIAGSTSAPHIITGEVPGPLLYVVDDLEFIQDEIFSYYWKRNPQGQHIDEPIDNNDHAMNTIKYMLARLPEPSEIVVPSNLLPPKWSQWHEVADEQRFGLQ